MCTWMYTFGDMVLMQRYVAHCPNFFPVPDFSRWLWWVWFNAYRRSDSSLVPLKGGVKEVWLWHKSTVPCATDWPWGKEVAPLTLSQKETCDCGIVLSDNNSLGHVSFSQRTCDCDIGVTVVPCAIDQEQKEVSPWLDNNTVYVCGLPWRIVDS